MKILFLVAALRAVLVDVARWLWRLSEHRADRRIGAALAAIQPASPGRFDPAIVAELPDSHGVLCEEVDDTTAYVQPAILRWRCP
jgi:hypothetical protein